MLDEIYCETKWVDNRSGVSKVANHSEEEEEEEEEANSRARGGHQSEWRWR